MAALVVAIQTLLIAIAASPAARVAKQRLVGAFAATRASTTG